MKNSKPTAITLYSSYIAAPLDFDSFVCTVNSTLDPPSKSGISQQYVIRERERERSSKGDGLESE